MDKKLELLELEQAFVGLSKLTNHKLVEATKKLLKNAKSDDNGIMLTKGKQCLDIRVSPACMERALDLLNTLFAILEKRGFLVVLKEDAKSATLLTCLKLGDEVVQIHVEEKLATTPHVLTDAEKKKLAKKEALSSNYARRITEWELYSWEPPKWDYHPSGQLQFKIDNLESSGLRQNMSDGTDGTSRLLEKQLPALAFHIIQAAVYLRNQVLEREERKRHQAEEERQRQERERQQFEEQKRVEHLDKLLRQWSKREEILQFLTWLDENMPSERRTEEFLQWYNWAKNYAQRLNPLARRDFHKSERPW